MYQISLIAAYVAGMVALFAPCCISYLFPAYLGNVFKERKQVLLMTLIYSLGIFAVMMPIVLGAKALQSMFFNLHDKTYLVGGFLLLIVAVLSFVGIKLPVPHLSHGKKAGGDYASTFTLGIFSGITSACCAPVLIGVMALSSLSPTFVQSMGVGIFYVLGMVTPLYVASMYVHKKNIMERPILKKVVGYVDILGREYPIFISNIVASVIFAVTGIVMLWLTSIGRLGMGVAESQVTKSINDIAYKVTDFVGGNIGIDLIFATVGIYIMYAYLKRAMKQELGGGKVKYVCPMHPEVVSDKPGKCPNCGGMDLVRVGGDEMEMNMEHNNHGGHEHHDHGSHEDMMSSPEAASDFLRRFWSVTVLLVPLLFLTRSVLLYIGIGDFAFRPYLQLLVASAIFYVSLVFFQHAKHEIMAKKYGMMTLVSVAVGAGYLFSAVSTFSPLIDAEFYLEISTLIWVLLFGHYLEARSSSAAGDALMEVAKLLPKTAHLIVNGGAKEVEVGELKEGDIVVVKPGEKVPADGVIVKGEANFDEAHISGESKPIVKSKDDEVVAGAICVDGSVRVRLTRVGENSTIGQIKKLISEAKMTKPNAQRLADKAAGVLTFVAIVVALITLVVWSFVVGESLVFAVTLSITVLVIACPHALGLAIPTVTTIATTLSARNGLFIKNMKKLEDVRNVDYVVMDKTGTLTEGEFGVSKVVSIGGSENEVLAIAASLEAESSHVIAMSIVRHAKKNKINMKDVVSFRNMPGKGVMGIVGGRKHMLGKPELINKKLWDKKMRERYKELVGGGKTVVVLADEEKVKGMIVLSDKIKSESREAVLRLHEMGMKVAMLTGDNEEVAREVSRELSIDEYFAEVLPEDKYKHIQKLQKGGMKVMMVGDGVNDAPSLTQADVGVAIGAGTDVAVEAGDIVLTRNNPMDVVRMVVLAREFYRKMVENLVWALGYNVVAIPAAAGVFIPFGFRLTPAVGAILMSLSSVIVVVNAVRLRRVELK